MANDILSQDEVDALMRGVGAIEEDDPEEESTGGVKSYDLTSQDRIVRGRMPTLEVINERFARLLRQSFFSFLRRSVEISVGQVKLHKYSEFVRSLVVPSNLNLVHLKPLRGTALVVFDPTLIFSVVDNFFGGDGRYHARIEGRDFTPVEQRIIQRMLEHALTDLLAAWAPVIQMQSEVARSEVNPQFASIATPSEVVVSTTFSVELDGGGGRMHLCFPYAMLEPIRDLLVAGMASDRIEVDQRWIGALRDEMDEVQVTLQARLTSLEMTLAQVLDLQVGQVLPFEMPDSITATAEGVPVLRGRYGQHKGHRALQVIETMTSRPNYKLGLLQQLTKAEEQK